MQTELSTDTYKVVIREGSRRGCVIVRAASKDTVVEALENLADQSYRRNAFAKSKNNRIALIKDPESGKFSFILGSSAALGSYIDIEKEDLIKMIDSVDRI